MPRTMSSAQCLLTGILAGLGQDPKPPDLVDCLRSGVVQDAGLLDEEIREIAAAMIKRCFNDNAVTFINEMMKDLKKRPPAKPIQIVIVRESLLAGIDSITDKIVSRQYSGDTRTIDAILAVQSTLSGDHGQTSQALRRCVKSLSIETLNTYANKLPNEEHKAREILAECILSKVGFWRSWRFMRRFSGKKTEEAKTEMQREQRIAILQTKLKESWQYPIILDDPHTKKRTVRETELFAELTEIDLDAVQWFQESAPSDRRED